MRKLTIALIILFGCNQTGCVSKSANVSAIKTPSSSPRPIAVLTDHDPWAMVIGADTPHVSLYDDGTLIYRNHDSKHPPILLTAKLTPHEFKMLRQSIGPTAEFLSLRSDYDVVPNVTDQSSVEITLADEKHRKTVSVTGYGFKKSDWGKAVFSKDPSAVATPTEFDRVYKILVAINPKPSVEWIPEFIEVMIWPYEYAPDVSAKWPTDWPGLTDPLTFRRGDSYSLFLPGEKLRQLRDFVHARREKQAVLIDGKKWSVSYRPVMPGSEVWTRIHKKA